MSVTNYTPSIDSGCSYNYSKLKDVVYLVSEDHVKDVHIDNGQAYIDDLDEAPLKINGFNIKFTETESLDERYKFTKTLTLSVNGYVNINHFQGKYYAIIETTDGTFYMTNVDFPSRVTYTFNLGANVSQTDFTFASLSNMPTLKLASSIGSSETVCADYTVNGIESLELIECNHVVINDDAKTLDIYGRNYDFRKVDFLGESCSLQEIYDGEKITETITFDIGFDSYKSAWHYSLLEFLENTYASVIEAKSDSAHQYNVGFGNCLHPSFEISSSTEKGESDKITITLTGTSEKGLSRTIKYGRTYHTETYWRYIKSYDNLKLYNCVDGVGQYLVQEEIDGLGNPTGDYKVYSGYSSFYSNYFNVVGTFSDVVTFESNECAELDRCALETDMPNIIYFSSITCYTYSLSAECNWSVADLPSYITVTPSSGNANTNYTVSVCNTQTPTNDLVEGYFKLRWGYNESYIGVRVGNDSGFVRPSVVNITCLKQDVTFQFDSSCPITITSIDPLLEYNLGDGILTVTVPFNSASSARTWSIGVKNCNNETQTLSIIQDQMYTRWATVSGYLCESGASYTKEEMYSGATSSDINTPTSSFKKGTKIKDNDDRCQKETEFNFLGHYYCVDGNKYKALEEMASTDGGTTWKKTGKTTLGEMVESASSWCELEATYSWVLTDEFQCGAEPTPTGGTMSRWVDDGYTCQGFDKWLQQKQQVSTDSGTTWTDTGVVSATTLVEANSEYCGYSAYKFMGHDSRGNSYSAACATSSSLTTGDTHVHTPLSDIVSAEIGTCVTEIGAYAMQDFEYLTAITIPSTVTKIGYSSFEQDQRLKTINLTNITSIGGYAFFNCRDLNHIRLNRNATIGAAAFDNCMSLEEINIPTTYNYSKIEYYTFRHCSGLTEVDIPANISGIGDEAFYGCTKLQSIIVRATTPATLGFHSLTNTNDCPIFVPDREIDMYKSRWTDYRDRIKGLSEYDDWIEYLETLTAEFSAATSLNFDGTANDKMVGTYEILWKRTVHTPSTDLVAEYISDFTCELIDGDEIEYSTSMRTYNESQHIVGDDTNHVGTLALYLYRNDSGSAKTATFNIYANFYSDYTKTTRFFKKTIGTIEITQQPV